MLSIALMSLMTVQELPVDKAAHFGVSWAVNHTIYEGCEKLMGNKTGCLVASTTTTALVGVLKESLDGNKNTGEQHAKDMLANAAGILASSIVITINW